MFNSDDFAKLIRTTKRYKAIIFDEAFAGLSSKGAISKENKKLVSLLMECRQQNLFIFIVLPTYFLLEKYCGLFRSHCLFHVGASKNNIKRRFFKVYNYQQKKELYLRGKALMDYRLPRITHTYRFYGKWPETIDHEAYKIKKSHAFHNKDVSPGEENTTLRQRNVAFHMLTKKYKAKYQEIEAYLNNFGCKIEQSGIGKQIRALSSERRKTEDS